MPSEIGVERIAGPETYFVAHGPLGLRLDLHQAGPRSCQRPSRRRHRRRAAHLVVTRHPHRHTGRRRAVAADAGSRDRAAARCRRERSRVRRPVAARTAAARRACDTRGDSAKRARAGAATSRRSCSGSSRFTLVVVDAAAAPVARIVPEAEGPPESQRRHPRRSSSPRGSLLWFAPTGDGPTRFSTRPRSAPGFARCFARPSISC